MRFVTRCVTWPAMLSFAGLALADEVQVAVGANFNAPMKIIAADFEKDNRPQGYRLARYGGQILGPDQKWRTLRGADFLRQRDAGQAGG